MTRVDMTREEGFHWAKYRKEHWAMLSRFTRLQFVFIHQTWLEGYRLGECNGIDAVKEGRVIV